MDELNLATLFAGVAAGATPILLATLGETITEKSGMINLSMDGSILLSAMTSFAVALETGSLVLGFAAGAVTAGIVAFIAGFFSLVLRQNQVAVGFVLTLLAKDLAYFIGSPWSRIPGPIIPDLPVPFLQDIPFIGPVFFDHNLLVYMSMILIVICWHYIYKTPQGLVLRAVGENPEAAYARGVNPKAVRMIYAVCGGFLVGLAGAAFSLYLKPGWGRPQGAEGMGWIVLALVIFGGWNPLKAAAGAYLFSFLQIMGIWCQSAFPSVPAQVFHTAPFPLMILALALMNAFDEKPGLQIIFRLLSGRPPDALGKSLSGV